MGAGLVTPLRSMVLAWLMVAPPLKSWSATNGATARPPALICTCAVAGRLNNIKTMITSSNSEVLIFTDHYSFEFTYSHCCFHLWTQTSDGSDLPTGRSEDLPISGLLVLLHALIGFRSRSQGSCLSPV